MQWIAGAYDLSVRSLRWVSPLLGRGSSKVARGIRGRVTAAAVLSEWGRTHRDHERPLIWAHAPSVGEGLQARVALEALLEDRPDLQAAYTYFSPSAAEMARGMPVDVAGTLPWDIRAELSEVLDTLAPSLIAFTKTEVWPGLTRGAVARGIPVTLVAATLPAGAGRLRPFVRPLLRSTFGALSGVLAISQEDGERFLRLGVREERIEVTGDPGIDSAWKRARDASPDAPYLAPFREDRRPTLVAGSTWGPDEEVLVPALAGVRARYGALRIVIAPHEPHEAHLRTLERRLEAAGFRTKRLGAVEARGGAGEVDAVVVDRVGVLAHLYTVGSMAFVGGGFGTDGLHSVLEPAAAGLPVLFGPAHGRSRAARELLEIGGAVSVDGGDALRRTVESWLRDGRLLEEAGGRASGYIEAHRGAARRTARAIARLLPSSHGAAR